MFEMTEPRLAKEACSYMQTTSMQKLGMSLEDGGGKRMHRS